MTKQSLAALRNTLTVQWPRELDEEARRFLIRTAKAGHARILQEQTARAGFPPDHTAYANRPGNPVVDSVKLPGPIVYEYDYRREIALIAVQELIIASPTVSGAYALSHTIFLNGQPVDDLPLQLARTDEIMIANTVPYSRRLEVGKTKSGRDFVLQVQPRIVERVAKGILMPRFGNSAKISFTYRELPGAYKAVGGLSSHYQTSAFGGGRSLSKKASQGILHRRKRDQRAEVVRAPAILINSY